MTDVLVVDDESDIRLITRMSLERAGWTVEEAHGGEEALERVADGCYDAVVLDQRMPGSTGLETARELRRRGFTGALVLFSAYLTPDIATAAADLGARTIDKAAIRDLSDTLRQMLATTA